MSETVAERIHDDLAVAMLRGDWPPGSRLPGVRRLAEQYETTVPTIQRVLERLSQAGLVSVRQGSGVTINDPTRARDLSLLPLWFEALEHDPKRAAMILGDFLELRRGVAAQMLRNRRDRLVLALPSLVPLVARLSAAKTVEDIATADAALVLAIVDAAGSFAVRTVLESVQSLITDVPLVAEAVYSDRSAHDSAVASVLAALAHSDAATAASALESALEAWDTTTISRFERLFQQHHRSE